MFNYDFLMWLYIINSVLIISHEIDSAYYKEWTLFKLPYGRTSFMIIHFFLLLFILYGLLLLATGAALGFFFSLLLSSGGIFAFLIHMYFIKIGRPEFKSFISIFILTSMFIISTIQMAIILFGSITVV